VPARYIAVSRNTAQQQEIISTPFAEETQMKSRFLTIGLGIAIMFGASVRAGLAQEFPTKPITMIVAFAAGGPVDIVAREVASKLTAELKQTVVVENQGGAGGKLGVSAVTRAAPDGYTLLFAASGNLTIQPVLEKKTEVLKLLAPVSMVSTSPQLLVVTSRLPITNLKSFVDYAKANPGKLNFGSGGTGSANHLGLELFELMAGVDIMHIPYKGISQAVIDMAGGQIDGIFSSMPSLKSILDSGSARAIGISAPSQANKDIPQISDVVPGFEYTTWYGILAPAKTPRAVIDRLNAAVRAVVADPELEKKLASQSLNLKASSPDELSAYMSKEAEKWGKVIEEAKIASGN
jgi:tripartite-type tricarboxylate transporter receptor subunit TctC